MNESTLLIIISSCFGGILAAIWYEIRIIRRKTNELLLGSIGQEKDILQIKGDITELKLNYKELDDRLRKIEKKN